MKYNSGQVNIYHEMTIGSLLSIFNLNNPIKFFFLRRAGGSQMERGRTTKIRKHG